MSILLGIFHKVNTGYWPISQETIKKISNYTAVVNNFTFLRKLAAMPAKAGTGPVSGLLVIIRQGC
jgi:hypothetical protein